MAARHEARRTTAREFFQVYTQGLTADDLQRLFTRDAREAYHFFSRGIDETALATLPLRKRLLARLRLFFLAFTLKLSPARRAIYGLALVATLFGLIELFDGVGTMPLPIIPLILTVHLPSPVWTDGTLWLLLGFALINLLVLLEVADRLTLKNDLEVAREIQQAMLPVSPFLGAGIEAFGQSRPANTVGGDFYDILPLADGRIAVVLGDVAGKGSPAALLMALAIAMLRTLVDEGLEPAALMSRLNAQVARHAPPSRFITVFFAVYDPATGGITYANAGHLPPLVCRADGAIERLPHGGMALGMFEGSGYDTFTGFLDPGDVLVFFSDGVTEAENSQGRPFDDAGLERVVRANRAGQASQIGGSIFAAVGAHARADRYADDLTVLVLKRLAAARAEHGARAAAFGV